MRRSSAVLLVATLAVWLTGCGTAIDPWEGEKARKRVVVTIPPLVSWVKAVGGDDVAVRCLCEKTGPHHYQTDMKDLTLFRRADLFLGIGLTLDDTFSDALYALTRRNDLPFIKLGQRLPKSMLIETKEDHDKGHEGHHHHHGKYDPHVWLGIPEAIVMVDVIAKELSAIDPDNAKTYTTNAKKYTDKLKALHTTEKERLANRKSKNIISFHESLQYFARSFGLKVAAVMEPGPGDEPSAGYLKELAEKIQKADKGPEKDRIGCITVEPQYSKGSADRLQEFLKGKRIVVPLVTVDPLETASSDDFKKKPANWYTEKMEENLEALADNLP